MKSKSSYLFAATALGLVAMIVWAASLPAQHAPNAGGITIEAPPLLKGNTTPADKAEFAPQRQPDSTVGPIIVPGGVAPRYYLPGSGDPTTAPAGVFPTVAFPTLTMPPDAKTRELIGAYLTQQSEINTLLKKYSVATDEGAKNSLRDQIAQATAAQFDLQQQVREREIEQLKKRLADVETTVQKRNELKDKIVEKRVAEILREPDQLGWEPLGPYPSTITAPAIGNNPTAYSTSPLGPIMPVPNVRYVPRTVVKYEDQVVVDAEGKQRVIRRPVSETVWGTVEGTAKEMPSADQQRPLKDHSPDSALQSTATLPDASDYQPITPSTMTVAEAAARVRFAEAKRDQLLGQRGKSIDGSELKLLEAELDLAKLIHARAQVEYEGRTKLLELDVRRAESVSEQAIAAHAEAQEVNKRAPNSIPATQVGRLKAAVDQARIELERAKTLLDVHQKSNAPQAEPPSVPTR